MDVLLILAAHAGRLVTKRELLDLAWPGVVVEENTLAGQISILRRLLGPDVIATVPRHGYRFVAPVLACAHGTPVQPLPRTAQQAALRTNLPANKRALIGRDVDYKAIDTLMRRCRLVSIVGTGGVGKSLLAQHLLTGQLGARIHGACWVELAAVTEAGSVPQAIASALGLGTGDAESVDGLLRDLAPLKLLLVLDNAEHLLAAVSNTVQQLLDAAPYVCFLVTSQAPLRIPAEQVYRLAPLSLPTEQVTVAQARTFGAVALFEESVRAVDARFSLTDANTPACTELCRAMDGVPLAIELAAARAPVLGVQFLSESLEQRLSLLTATSNRWAPARQLSLRAAVDWSHSLLDVRERIAFRRIGVVVGSASLEVVQAVVAEPQSGDMEMDRWAAVDALQNLVNFSLVDVLTRDEDPAAAPRYRLLESPRAYALERLAAAGELDATRLRLAKALAARFDQAWSHVWSGSIAFDDWTHGLEPDFDNARMAFAWAAAHGEPSLALAIGRTLLHALSRAAEAECLALADACERLISSVPSVPLRLSAWLVVAKQWNDTHIERSQLALSEALALARSLCEEGGDPFWLYLALSQSAVQRGRMGEKQALRMEVTEMRTLERAEWPPIRREVACAAEYYFAQANGDTAAGPDISRKRIALRRAAGIDFSVIVGNLIYTETAAGNAQAAARIGMDLVAQLHGTRDEYGLNHARLHLCSAWLVLGETTNARQLIEMAWPTARGFDDIHAWADCLAALAAQEGRLHTAARLIGFADREYRRHGRARGGNEARALERSCEQIRVGLNQTDFEVLRREGSKLDDDDARSLGLATREK